MNFNHNAETETEAVGFSDQDFQDWKDKNKVVIKTILNEDNVKFSEVAQMLAEKMSYNELIFTAARYVLSKAGEIEAKKQVLNIIGNL